MFTSRRTVCSGEDASNVCFFLVSHKCVIKSLRFVHGTDVTWRVLRLRCAQLYRVDDGPRSFDGVPAEMHENPFAVFLHSTNCVYRLNNRCPHESERVTVPESDRKISKTKTRAVVSRGRKRWSREPMSNGTNESCHGQINYIYFIFFFYNLPQNAN